VPRTGDDHGVVGVVVQADETQVADRVDAGGTGRDQQHRPAAHLGLRRRGRERQVLAEALLADPQHDTLGHDQL